MKQLFILFTLISTMSSFSMGGIKPDNDKTGLSVTLGDKYCGETIVLENLPWKESLENRKLYHLKIVTTAMHEGYSYAEIKVLFNGILKSRCQFQYSPNDLTRFKTCNLDFSDKPYQFGKDLNTIELITDKWGVEIHAIEVVLNKLK